MDATIGFGMSVLRTIGDLVEAGLVAPGDAPALKAVTSRYAVGLTPEIVELIDPSDPSDPIARQFIPSSLELDHKPEEIADPIADKPHSPLKGLVHRYPDRVLLKPLHTCPVYCRFCFRREMVGPDGDGTLSDAELAAAFDYISARPDIFEVIVSGGDPLMMSARRIGALARMAGDIGHIRVMRWHSRIPLVDPDRIDRSAIAALKEFPGAIYVALHANHPREFTPKGISAIARLVDAGIVLVSQTVLLKGINDDPVVLDALMRLFVANRVTPYYLHQGDLAPGTSHFRTTLAEGQAIMRRLRGRLSGLAQPTYVVDLPGGYGKVPIGPNYLSDDDIIDPAGVSHTYPTKRPDL